MINYYRKLEKARLKKHKKILRFIIAFTKKTNKTPTRQKIADHLGCAVNNVSHHLKGMEKAGLISFDKKSRYRNILITDKGQTFLDISSLFLICP